MSFALRHISAVFLSAAILLTVCGASISALAENQSGNTATLSPREKLQQLQRLLDDSDIKAWLSTQPAGLAVTPPTEIMSVLSGRLEKIRGHLRRLMSAAANLPGEMAQVPARLDADAHVFGRGHVLGLLALVVFLSFGARWAVRRFQDQAGKDGTSVVAILAFAVGGMLPLVIFEWPPVLQKVMIGLLIVLSGTWLTVTIVRVLLGPEPIATDADAVARTPLLDIAPKSGAFWGRRVSFFIGYFLIGWTIVAVMPSLDFSQGARDLAAYVLSIGLLAIAIEAVWHRPDMRDPERRNTACATLLTLLFVVLWVLSVLDMQAFLWLGIYAVILPPVLQIAGEAAKAIAQRRKPTGQGLRLFPVLAERATRALVVVLAVFWLGAVLGLGLGAGSITNSDAMVGKILRGVLSSIVILLVADLLWQIAKASLELKLEQAHAQVGGTDEEMARRGKLMTLLPIFRNVLAVALAVIAVLMVLAELGVQIGPLVAGAGVFGVAIGFGAQTLVKDVISGMFYLWDDAFRVGEYIQSGKYMGVVESFSLRSVKLRHHRGPIFTVPFGELGAVENMSRDWVIVKLMLGVTYDTDIAKVKKVIKEVGGKLLENPDFAPHIIETLKMKGVDKFADFSINISLAMMTKPGQQFVIRRSANALIREAFKLNGIEFAFPTVQIAGERKTSPSVVAAAHNVINTGVGKPPSA